MIQFIKNLWIKWKYRKYFREMKNQSEYYSILARAACKAYQEFNKPENINIENMYVEIPVEFLESDIPELKGDVVVPDLLHTKVNIKELVVDEKKIL